MIDKARLLAVVGEAAAMAHRQWPGAGGTVSSWDKSPGNPVCDVDLAVDRFLKRELTALLPAAGWLSEETADNAARVDRSLVWVVDPIDGTRDFLRGRTGWAVSVALVSEGRPLIGVLEAPALGKSYLALAGQGAWCGTSKLAVSGRTDLHDARMPADTLAKADRVLQAVAKPNSIALRVAKVAAGEADLIAAMRWGYEWDIAAAMLIAREAGARVTDVLGQTLRYNKRDPRSFGLLVATPGIHAAAVEHFADRARAKRGDALPGDAQTGPAAGSPQPKGR